MLSEISLMRDYWKSWTARVVSYICEAHFQVYSTHTYIYKCAGEHAECSQRQGEGCGLRLPLREKTWTVDETDGSWADQQALYHINIKPSPCPTVLYLHTQPDQTPLTVMCREDVIIYRPQTCWMKARWIAGTYQLIPFPGRCAWCRSARYTSGQEKNIHHIAWKTISLCAGWSTLYHSNSGQGNREMMREKRN